MLKPFFARTRESLRNFFELEASAGVCLALAALLAIIVSNSPLSSLYETFTHFPGEINLGEGLVVLKKPLMVWVNDLWMAAFFFLVGLELKRELMVGELSDRSQIALPMVAAVCGMAVPSFIYSVINWGDPIAMRGWAIPAATDIAFALGVLMLLGSRVPVALKIFLTAVAILDDMGAIVVIAIFYTENLSLLMLGAALAGVALLLVLNRAGVVIVVPYVLVGIAIWVFVLKSGVHATLAGVVTALAIPLRGKEGDSPLQRMEHALHPWVAFGILPAFAFVNAGVSLQGITMSTLLDPVSLGIALGLFLGKALGIFVGPMVLIRLGLARLPDGATWLQFFGLSVLCGIGFTMSLFIGGLAFEGQSAVLERATKLGVLLGSITATFVGSLILVLAARKSR